jgi:hypothetical protein
MAQEYNDVYYQWLLLEGVSNVIPYYFRVPKPQTSLYQYWSRNTRVTSPHKSLLRFSLGLLFLQREIEQSLGGDEVTHPSHR